MSDVKVLSCEVLKVHEKDGKKTNIYKVGLSDGMFGESFGKEIPVGTPVDQIEITDAKFGGGKNFKLKSSGKGGWGGGGGRPPDKKNASFALSYAKDMIVAILPVRPDLNSKTTKEISEVIVGIADKFYQWLETKNPGH